MMQNEGIKIRMELMVQETRLTREAVQQTSTEMQESPWLLQQRLKAFERFGSLPMPEFRYGISIKINTNSIDLTQMDPLTSLTKKSDIKVNTPPGIRLMTLAEAYQEQPKLVEQFFGSIVPPQGKLEALNYAFLSSAFVLHIPRGMEVKQPITIMAEPSSDFMCEHLLVIAEPLSKATIIESAISPDQAQHGYRGKIVEIMVGEGAQLSYANIQDISQSMAHFTVKKAKVGKDATMNWLDCSLGGKVTLSNVLTDLEKPGARTNNWGMFFGGNNQQFDAHYSAIHKAPNTNSDMLTKGVLRDKAKAIYRGLIHITREAQKSVGMQKADTLLLNAGTEADAVPSLEIDNSDVKCSHGSSIGQIDKEKMFYLFSRGLSEEEAMRQIVRGFFEPLAMKIADTHLQEELRKMIEVKLQ